MSHGVSFWMRHRTDRLSTRCFPQWSWPYGKRDVVSILTLPGLTVRLRGVEDVKVGLEVGAAALGVILSRSRKSA